MSKQNEPLRFEVTVPGQFTAFEYFDPATYWSVKDCSGNLRVQVDNYPIIEPVVAGQQEKVVRKFRRLRVTSDIAEVVFVVVGDDPPSDSRKIVQLGGGGGGGTNIVQGPVPYETTLPK